MELPVQVSFRHVPYDEAVAADIRTRAARLLTFNARILNCHVAVEQPHHGHVHGNRYHVRIELAVPGELLIVDHEPSPISVRNGDDGETRQKSDESAVRRRDVAVTVHEAFNEVRRQLEDYVRRRRGAGRASKRKVSRDEVELGTEASWPPPTHTGSDLVH